MAFKTYFKFLALGLGLNCVLFLLALLYQIGAPTESSRWISEINTDKINIANSIDAPKILVVSGSNGLFGISCKLIHEEANFPCVNASTNVGLGLEYILNFARLMAKEGDLIIMPLEYHVYSSEEQINDVVIDYVFARNPQYLLSVDWLDKIHFISGISYPRLARGIMAQIKTPEPRLDGYQSENLNEYGDETSNREANITKYQRKQIADIEPFNVLEKKGYIQSTQGLEVLKNFIIWAQKNNIQIIATWPNTVWFEEYSEPETQLYFQSIKDFYQSLNVPVLGEPRDFMYDKSMFYDTEYHLHDRGVRLRTQQLIQLLQPYLDRLKAKQR